MDLVSRFDALTPLTGRVEVLTGRVEVLTVGVEVLTGRVGTHGDGQRRLVWLPMATVARWRGHALVAMETGLLRWRGYGRRADTV